MWNPIDPNNLPTEEVLAINKEGETLKGKFVDDQYIRFGGTIYVESTDEEGGFLVDVTLYNPVAYIKMSDLKKMWEDQQG